MNVARKKKKPAFPDSPWPKKLRVLMKQHGMTQVQLAARLRLSQSQISAFLSGERLPTRPIAYLIELLESGNLP